MEVVGFARASARVKPQFEVGSFFSDSGAASCCFAARASELPGPPEDRAWTERLDCALPGRGMRDKPAEARPPNGRDTGTGTGHRDRDTGIGTGHRDRDAV